MKAVALPLLVCLKSIGMSAAGGVEYESEETANHPWFAGEKVRPSVLGRMFASRSQAGYVIGEAEWSHYTEERGEQSHGNFIATEILAWQLPDRAPELPFKIEFSHLRVSNSGVPQSGPPTGFPWSLIIEPDIKGPRPFLVRLHADGRYEVFPLPSLEQEVVDDLRAAARLHLAADFGAELLRLVDTGRAEGMFTRSMILVRLRLLPEIAHRAEMVGFLLARAVSSCEWEASSALDLLAGIPETAHDAIDKELLGNALMATIAMFQDSAAERSLLQQGMMVQAFDAVMLLANYLPADSKERLRLKVRRFNTDFLIPHIATWHEESADYDDSDQLEIRIEHAMRYEQLSKRLDEWADGAPGAP